jgi:ATP-binding cassette subfamily A (ABC1) protein 1
MLTGDVAPSGGTAILGELDILKHAQDVRSLMGYCPQADALDELLTAEEVSVSCFCIYPFWRLT